MDVCAREVLTRIVNLEPLQLQWQRTRSTRSEGAPVPIARNAGYNLFVLNAHLASGGRDGRSASSVHGAGGDRLRAAGGVVGRAGVATAAAAAAARDGRGLAVGAAAPRLELGVAVLASAAHDAARVVVGVLVERDLES